VEHYTIDKLSWHLDAPGNEEFIEASKDYFFFLCLFLQTNGLVHEPIVSNRTDIPSDAEITTKNLTLKGRLLIKTGYVDYQRFVDNGGDPRDTSILAHALEVM
jgi:hypothetical protein